jgi:hypothetical protein
MKSLLGYSAPLRSRRGEVGINLDVCWIGSYIADAKAVGQAFSTDVGPTQARGHNPRDPPDVDPSNGDDDAASKSERSINVPCPFTSPASAGRLLREWR